MAGKILLQQNNGGKYSFDIKAGDGQTLMRSREYNNAWAARMAISSARRNAVDRARFHIFTRTGGWFYVKLYAGNNRTIALSGGRPSMYACENLIRAVMQMIDDAPVDCRI